MWMVLSAILTFFIVPLPLFAAHGEFKIGVTLALTGQGASWGQNAQRAIDLAVEEINAKGGVNGKKFKPLYEDFGQFDLKRASSAAHKFVSVDKVDLLLTLWSEDTEVVLPIASSKNLITLSIAAGKKDLPKRSPLLFRVWPSDETMVHASIGYARGLAAKNAAILYEQSAYHEAQAKLINEEWSNKMQTEPVSLPVRSDSADFRTEILKIKNANSDVLFVQTGYGIGGLIAKQVRSLGIKFPIISTTGSDDPNFRRAAGSSALGIIFPRYKPATSTFVSKFKSKYNAAPGVPAANAYDAVKLIAWIIEHEGVSTEGIKKGLLSVRNFPGASGPITLDQNGDRIGKEVQLLRIVANGSEVIEGA